MFQARELGGLSKPEIYRVLAGQLQSLIETESDRVANLANTAAFLFHSLDEVNWCGFYLLHRDQLVVGPFQGRPACVRIPLGRGVCGTVAAQRKTLRVPDVNKFSGHISCDPASRSEIVLPLLRDGELLGVLDLDSPHLDRFDLDDARGLETLVAILTPKL